MLQNLFHRIFRKDMRWIYLSPHFDDVALSCGGLLWEQTHSGIAAEIWTVCAGDPPPGPESDFAKQMHEIWQTGTAAETVALRRIEDKKAARRLGATVQHLDVPDAIYRRSNTGTLFYQESVFVDLNARETRIAEEVARQISEKLTQYDTLVCPLAIGGHVDHRITRAAAELLNRPLWYYADIPYLLSHRDELAPVTKGMNSKTFFVSPKGLSAWQNSIAAHASQISSLFEDVQDMRQKIKEYAQINSGLPLWEHDEKLSGH
jgi:LmbE family N-acetylglucosaminyl deacetylase